MKTTEEATVVLNLVLFQAERIETAFGRVGDIASAFRSVINEARRKEAQAKKKTPDEALIPVTITLTLKQARTMLKMYSQWIDAPTDREIYILVKKALEESDK